MAGTADELDHFLASVERQACRLARHYTRDPDEALDLVQDAMLRLARRYAHHPADEWTPLFFGILRNRIRDWQRRETLRARIFFWRRESDGADAQVPDPLEQATASAADSPERSAVTTAALRALETALRELPARQREAFLLRSLDGMDLRATARAMGVSEGSVKTHHSRALRRLRDRLGAHWHD